MGVFSWKRALPNFESLDNSISLLANALEGPDIVLVTEGFVSLRRDAAKVSMHATSTEYGTRSV